MAKGSKRVSPAKTKARLLAENRDLEKKIQGLLIPAEGTNITPPCLVYRTRSKRTQYNWELDPKGVYRQMRIKRGGNWVWEYVHRLVFILHYGSIAEGYDVCHLCHNRSCANIEHLFSATPETHRGKNGMDWRFHKKYEPILRKAKGKMIIQALHPSRDAERLLQEEPL